MRRRLIGGVLVAMTVALLLPYVIFECWIPWMCGL
jgi:hypothetical protein